MSNFIIHPVPTAVPAHLRPWMEARLGMSLHWGLYSIAGRGEWLRAVERLTVEQYQGLFDAFKPLPGCCRPWATAAKQAGASHVVLTAKHHDGFCLWDTALTEYKATRTPAGRDLISEYVQSLRDQGLGVGLYYSLVDWHHPDYGPVYGDRQHPLRHDPKQQKLDPQRDWGRYVRYVHGQVEELLTRYGKIDVLYFDFSYWNFIGEKWHAAELMRLVRRLQPTIVVNDRLGTEAIKQTSPPEYVGDFDHAEQNIPRACVVNSEGRRLPWEAWFTLSNSWCWSENDSDFKSPATIVRALVNCVSKGGNLCLNVGPDASGQIGSTELQTLKSVGDWMTRNRTSIYGCGEVSLPKPEWGRWTISADGRHLFAHILEEAIGHLSLEGLKGRVKNPIVIANSNPAVLSGYWNPGIQTFDGPDDIFLNLKRPSQATWPLPDRYDTVIRMDIVNDPNESSRLVEQLQASYNRETRHVPID